jgi:ornithine decarboxylase
MGTTFYAVSRQRVAESMATWKSLLPTVTPYYAVKCNPDPTLVRWLGEYGAGFDCASANEVRIVNQVDYGANIIFANPCKSSEEIRAHAAANIQTTVVDSFEEVDKLAENGWKASSLIRIRVEDGGSMMPFSAKFGLDPAHIKALGIYARTKGQHISGISFHVGSGCKDPAQYSLAIQEAAQGIRQLRSIGHEATTIDIGGGFIQGPLFRKTADTINPLLHRLDPSINVIAEPGRFFAASSHDLFVRVIGKKPAKKGWRYTVDESLYGQFSCVPFDYAKPKWIRVRGPKESARRSQPAILYGRTCDSLDYIASAEDAEELEEGDWLWFPHMGAYTTATSTEFNGFPKPPTYIIEDEVLPNPKDFGSARWPRGLKYVSPVKVPS